MKKSTVNKSMEISTGAPTDLRKKKKQEIYKPKHTILNFDEREFVFRGCKDRGEITITLHTERGTAPGKLVVVPGAVCYCYQ